VRDENRASRLLMLLFAIGFLFETWIWGGMVRAVAFIAARIPWARFKVGAQRIINRLPAFVAVLLFGVPLAAMEFGSFLSVVAIAFGHVVLGAVMYGLMKVVGVGLVAVIFDLTREKLMTLPWFVVLHEKFVALHDFAHRLVQPYRDAAQAYLRGWRDWARGYGSRGREALYDERATPSPD